MPVRRAMGAPLVRRERPPPRLVGRRTFLEEVVCWRFPGATEYLLEILALVDVLGV